jgi:hypothetical protein
MVLPMGPLMETMLEFEMESSMAVMSEQRMELLTVQQTELTSAFLREIWMVAMLEQQLELLTV